MKRYSILLIFLFCTSSVFAQSYYLDNERTFNGGLIAGTTFTQVDGDNYKGYRKIGFTGGGIVYAKISQMFAPSIEILYTQRGSRIDEPGFVNDRTYYVQDYGIDLDYAELSILLNYYDSPRKSTFGAGLSYSQLISGKEYANTVPKIPDSVDLNLDHEFRKYDLNFVLSGSLHLYKGIYFNARFQYSLLSVRNNAFRPLGRDEQFNNSFVLRVMYLFK